MSSVQFKIFYGDNFERCKMHRMKKERFELITYQEFACEVLKTVGAFLEGKTPRDVRIQYKDDEDTFVNLNCDEDLVDAFRCLWPVDNSEELYRLSVRVHTTATPVQAVNVRTERTIVNEPAKRRCASPTPRKQLHFTVLHNCDYNATSNVLRQGFSWDITSTCLCFQHLFNSRFSL